MRKLSSELLVVIVLAGVLPAAAQNQPNPVPAWRPVAPQAGQAPEAASESAGKSSQTTGALPQTTQAEKVRQAEEALQNQLLAISQALDNLEKRIAQMRRLPDSPPREDVGRSERDIALLMQELDKMAPKGLSPLLDVQRSDLNDRLLELEVSLEVAKRRWGGTWTVFGMDFFANAPAVPGAEQRPVPPNYRLRIGDKLRIAVLSSLGQETEYERTVDTSGCIHVPGAGTLRAADKTCEQLRQAIASAIRSRFRQLRVSVSVESTAALLVQVAGDVARPGAYVLSGMPTLMTALYQAGGPTKSGTFRRVELTRIGEPKRILDLYDFVMRGNRDQDPPLKDGDLVFVPPVGDTIAIEGDVVRPARYEPDFPITLGEALKMAGGVKATGLHTVQVERVENNECRVLLNEPIAAGEGKSNFPLKPGDVVTVKSVRPDRTNQVAITGPVCAPGLYGYTEGMRVSDLVKLAQGLDPKQEVYGGRADILRTDPHKGTEIVTLDLDRALAGDPAHNLELRKLDQVFIYQPDQVVFRPRVVTVQGAVANPGTYRRTDGMRVSDAIAAAGGLMPEAYLERADLIRHAPDGSTELIRVALQQAMAGDPAADLKLMDRDELTVREHSDVRWANRVVRIEGAVQRPGVYVRSQNMRVTDLLFAAGGLLPEAAEAAELARQIGGGESKVLKVPNLASLVPGSPEDLLLEDRDVVTVPGKNPSLRASEVVFVTGEVARPGPYALSGRNERLVDLIRRAGGLTKDADPRGTLFLRQKESFENSQQERDVDLILRKTRAFADKQFLTQLAKLGVALPTEVIQAVQRPGEYLAKPAGVVVEEKLEKEVTPAEQQTLPEQQAFEKAQQPTGGIGKAGPAQAAAGGGAISTARPGTGTSGSAPNNAVIPSPQPARPGSASALGPKIAELAGDTTSGFEGRFELAALTNSARVSIDLNKAFADPDSPDNIPLRQGDQVFIPRVTNVVRVVGAVLHPHDFAAGPGNSVDHYIRRSGGFAQDAAKNYVIVVRSNGDALPARQVRSVEPGDTIVVPTTGLVEIAKKWEQVGSVTKVISDILSSVFILTRF